MCLHRPSIQCPFACNGNGLLYRILFMNCIDCCSSVLRTPGSVICTMRSRHPFLPRGPFQYTVCETFPRLQNRFSKSCSDYQHRTLKRWVSCINRHEMIRSTVRSSCLTKIVTADFSKKKIFFLLLNEDNYTVFLFLCLPHRIYHMFLIDLLKNKTKHRSTALFSPVSVVVILSMQCVFVVKWLFCNVLKEKMTIRHFYKEYWTFL